MSIEKQMLFLGGIFTDHQYSIIESNTDGVLQHAADGLQKKLLKGFESVYAGDIVVVNLPFIGCYPQRFKLPFLEHENCLLGTRIKVKGQSFSCRKFVKFFSRCRAAISGLIEECDYKPVNLVIYSAHIPFIAAALALRMRNPQSHICLIIPDLPWYMGEGGFLYNILKRIERQIFCWLARMCDSYVLLTESMAVAIPVPLTKSVIIEGISEQRVDSSTIKYQKKDKSIFSFTYTGTLARRYGIMELLKAFEQIEQQNVRLCICGNGECREKIIALSEVDKRILYMGQVSPEQARFYQSTASVLVNPRSPGGDYTKYSFPSKIMEYMSTGRPVLMYRLPGIPDEYYEYCLSVDEGPSGGLRKSMIDAIEMSADKLTTLGSAAQKFVYEKKNPMVQCKKIIDLFHADTNAT